MIASDLEIALAKAVEAGHSDVGDALLLLQRLARHRRRGNGVVTLKPEDVPAFSATAIADTEKDALSKAVPDADGELENVLPHGQSVQDEPRG